MTDEKIKYMEKWCENQGLILELDGACGFGRECVGVLSKEGHTYPDYEWYDDDDQRLDKNGSVWCPKNAYHKHPCVAVLGRGEESISQLYEWILWFDKNHFVYKKIAQKCDDLIELRMGRNWHHRMEKQ